MSRPRKVDPDLPPRLRRKGGAFYYVTKARPPKWIPLGSNRDEALKLHARLAAADTHATATSSGPQCAAPGRHSDEARRFWSKVDRPSPESCWPWTASLTKSGYGQFGLDRGVVRAHRIALEFATGKSVDGHVVRHLCDNKSCCNPAHLVMGTHSENVADRVQRGRSSTRGKLSKAVQLTGKIFVAARDRALRKRKA